MEDQIESPVLLNLFDQLTDQQNLLYKENSTLNKQFQVALKLLDHYRKETVQLKSKQKQLLEQLENTDCRFSCLKKEISKESQKVYRLEKENRHLKKELCSLKISLSKYDSGVSSLNSMVDIQELDENISSDEELLFDKSDDCLDECSFVSTVCSKVSNELVNRSTPRENKLLVKQESPPLATSSVVKTTPVVESKLVSSSVIDIKPSLTPDLNHSRRQSLNTPENLFKLSKPKLGENLLESRRKHEFQLKKAFKSVTCCVCNKSVGFCSSYSVCLKCKSVTHTTCQAKLDTLCTYGSGASSLTPGSRKSIDLPRKSLYGTSFMIIGDFVLMKERPFIPAFLVKCCEDIEKRLKLQPSQLVETSVKRLYTYTANPIAKRQVKPLLEKLVQTKSGIPNLDRENSSVIAGAVLSFLGNLTEPLITNILSRDFATAITSTTQSKLQMLEQCLAQMPGPNRDTLAFIMLHLYNMIEMANNKTASDNIKAHFITIFHVPIASYNEFAVSETGKTMSKRILTALFDILPRATWSDLLTI